MLPLLQQKDGSSFAGVSIGYEGRVRSIDKARVFRTVDEAGQIAIVPAGPAGGLWGLPTPVLSLRQWRHFHSFGKAREPLACEIPAHGVFCHFGGLTILFAGCLLHLVHQIVADQRCWFSRHGLPYFAILRW